MTKKIEDALAWLSVDEEATHNADMQADLIAARIELATLEDATWNAAIEAAAVKCETADVPIGIEVWAGSKKAISAATATGLAGIIRSLKRGQPPASARPPCDSCHERPRAAGLSVCESCAKGIYGRKVTP